MPRKSNRTADPPTTSSPKGGGLRLIVDCYNVLYAPMPPVLAGLDEERLCELLARGPWRRRAVVVCDGQVKPGVPARSPVDGVALVYSGKQCSADSLIAKMIREDTAPRRLIVVSSDRAIQRVAQRRRAQVWPSDQLVSLLTQLIMARSKPQSPDEKLGVLSADETAYWLNEFGYHPDGKMDNDDILPEDRSEWR